MRSLKQILSEKSQRIPTSGSFAQEDGIQQGRVYFFTPGVTSFNDVSQRFCWKPSTSGTAVVEIWGAGGSGAALRCCGSGIPGNPGAYSSRKLFVDASSFICGCVGMSCGDQTTACFRGCSESTEICFSGLDNAGAMCAQGGRGGETICINGSNSAFCCFIAAGYEGTVLNTNCGVICNYSESENWIAGACGGQTNINGGISCVSFLRCFPAAPCCHHVHVHTSPGIISNQGVLITYQPEQGVAYSNWSGGNIHPFTFALNSAGRTPQEGMPYTTCWNGTLACGSNQAHGCVPWLPYGVPGLPPSPCSNTWDYATRGGHGAVRIKFIGS